MTARCSVVRDVPGDGPQGPRATSVDTRQSGRVGSRPFVRRCVLPRAPADSKPVDRCAWWCRAVGREGHSADAAASRATIPPRPRDGQRGTVSVPAPPAHWGGTGVPMRSPSLAVYRRSDSTRGRRHDGASDASTVRREHTDKSVKAMNILCAVPFCVRPAEACRCRRRKGEDRGRWPDYAATSDAEAFPEALPDALPLALPAPPPAEPLFSSRYCWYSSWLTTSISASMLE